MSTESIINKTLLEYRHRDDLITQIFETEDREKLHEIFRMFSYYIRAHWQIQRDYNETEERLREISKSESSHWLKDHYSGKLQAFHLALHTLNIYVPEAEIITKSNEEA
jgi:hypothetical protein